MKKIQVELNVELTGTTGDGTHYYDVPYKNNEHLSFSTRTSNFNSERGFILSESGVVPGAITVINRPIVYAIKAKSHVGYNRLIIDKFNSMGYAFNRGVKSTIRRGEINSEYICAWNETNGSKAIYTNKPLGEQITEYDTVYITLDELMEMKDAY